MHMIILWLHIFNRCNRWYLYGMLWGLFLEGWGVSYGMNWVLALAYCYVLIVKVFELNYYNMLLKYRSNIAINFTLLLIHITIIYSILGLKIVINLWVLPWVHTWQIWPRRRCGFWLLYRIWWRRHIDELVCRRRCSGAAQHHRWRVVYEQKFNRICVLRVHTHKRVQCYHKRCTPCKRVNSPSLYRTWLVPQRRYIPKCMCCTWRSPPQTESTIVVCPENNADDVGPPFWKRENVQSKRKNSTG